MKIVRMCLCSIFLAAKLFLDKRLIGVRTRLLDGQVTTPVLDYWIDYESRGLHEIIETSRVSKVKVCEGSQGLLGRKSAQCLRPTTFTWTKNDRAFRPDVRRDGLNKPMAGALSTLRRDVASYKLGGDFDNDGQKDIYYAEYPTTGGTNLLAAGEIFLTQPDGSMPTSGIPSGIAINFNQDVRLWDTDLSRLRLTDVNGDGKTDVVLIDAPYGQTSSIKIYLSKGIVNGSSGFSSAYFRP